jgi:DNA helicase HerA-like ATPase
VYKSFCKDEILKLAREGRKYGLSLCLVSQRPRWVDPTALSQCGNFFIFRIQNADDKKHIFDSASLPDLVREVNISKFAMGEMVVTGDVSDEPVKCIVSEMDEAYISAERVRIKDKYLEILKAKLNT